MQTFSVMRLIRFTVHYAESSKDFLRRSWYSSFKWSDPASWGENMEGEDRFSL